MLCFCCWFFLQSAESLWKLPRRRHQFHFICRLCGRKENTSSKFYSIEYPCRFWKLCPYFFPFLFFSYLQVLRHHQKNHHRLLGSLRKSKSTFSLNNKKITELSQEGVGFIINRNHFLSFLFFWLPLGDFVDVFFNNWFHFMFRVMWRQVFYFFFLLFHLYFLLLCGHVIYFLSIKISY